MNTLTFSIKINADKSAIWNALWEDNNYRKWSAVFFDGSYVVVNDWNEGSKVHFLGEGQNGIYSVIEKYIPNELVRFKHVGNVVDGKEQSVDPETEKWSGAKESYAVTEIGNGLNMLTLELNVMDEHLDFMKEKTPKALKVILKMCEGK